MSFDQDGASSLVTAVFGRQSAQLGAVLVRNRIGVSLGRLTTRNHPGPVQFSLGAMAVGIAAFSAEPIEGPLHHGLGALETAEGPA